MNDLTPTCASGLNAQGVEGGLIPPAFVAPIPPATLESSFCEVCGGNDAAEGARTQVGRHSSGAERLAGHREGAGSIPVAGRPAGLFRICSYCQVALDPAGPATPAAGQTLTHGVCPACLARELASLDRVARVQGEGFSSAPFSTATSLASSPASDKHQGRRGLFFEGAGGGQ